MGRNRRFLKLAKMTLVSSTNGATVEPKIRKRVYLPSSNQNLSVALAPVEEPSHISNGSISPYENVRDTEQVERFPDATKNLSIDMIDNLKEQRRDIDRILISVAGLQSQMYEVRRSIEWLKASKNPSYSDQAPSNDHGFTKEIELLTENVCNMNSKVYQIDGLNLELKVMKRRIQRLEDGNMSTQSSHTVTGFTQDAPQAKFARMTGSLARRPLSSAKGTPHLYYNADLVETSVQKDDMDPSPSLPAIENGDMPVQQNFALMSRGVNNDNEHPILLQRQSMELDELDSARKGVATAPKPAKLVATLKQRISTPETDVTGSITSSSSSRVSPIQLRPPKPSTPEDHTVNGKAVSTTSLNNQVVPVSDTEGNGYNPISVQTTTLPNGSSRGNNTTRGSSRHRRGGVPVRFPTPEQEDSDWAGPTITASSAARARGIMRRGVSGRMLAAEPNPKRRKTISNIEASGKDSFRSGLVTAVSALDGMQGKGPPSLTRGKKETAVTRDGLSDSRYIKRARDDLGRLLRPDGRIDRRSMRYWKDKNVGDIGFRKISENEAHDANLEAGNQVDLKNGNGAKPLETNRLVKQEPENQPNGTESLEGTLSRPRDAGGLFLKPDGTRDGRSGGNRAQYLKSRSSSGEMAAARSS